MNRKVYDPVHYTKCKHQPWDIIPAFGFGFDLGNAVKYLERAGKKEQETEIDDLEKALNYIGHQFTLADLSPSTLEKYWNAKVIVPHKEKYVEEIIADWQLPEALAAVFRSLVKAVESKQVTLYKRHLFTAQGQLAKYISLKKEYLRTENE